MGLYQCVFTLFLMLFLMEDSIKKNKEIYNLLKKLAIIIMIFLITMRNENFSDTPTYIKYFTREINIDFEMGYKLLNMIINKLTNNIRILFFIISTISMIHLYRFINFFSEYYFFSIAFYFARWMFLRDFNQLRYAIACSFLYIGFIYLYKNRKIKFALTIIIGSLFHKTLIFSLSFLLFKKFYKKFHQKEWLYIIILILPFFNTKELLSKIMLFLFPSEINYIIGYKSIRKSYISVYSSYFFLICCFFYQRYKKIISLKTKFLLCIYLYSNLITSIFFQFADITGRLSGYFNVELVLQDKIVSIFKSKIIAKIFLTLWLILIYYMNVVVRLKGKLN